MAQMTLSQATTEVASIYLHTRLSCDNQFLDRRHILGLQRKSTTRRTPIDTRTMSERTHKALNPTLQDHLRQIEENRTRILQHITIITRMQDDVKVEERQRCLLARENIRLRQECEERIREIELAITEREKAVRKLEERIWASDQVLRTAEFDPELHKHLRS